jgi:hypothetical protein
MKAAASAPAGPAPAGPAEEATRSHHAAVAAFREAVDRNARLWRADGAADAPVPGLSWTAGETAAHMIGDLRDTTEALAVHARGEAAHTPDRSGSQTQASAAANARHLTLVRERNLPRLAELLEEAADAYLRVVTALTSALENQPIPTPSGLVVAPPTMTSLLLGEQLIHGLDIARATRVEWSISRRDALLVIPGVLVVAPQYLIPTRNLHVSYELRMRGGPRYRMAIDDGSAVITAAVGKADCTISADPVAFLLLCYERVPEWTQLVRGKLFAGGRRPWLAARFGGLLTSP